MMQAKVAGSGRGSGEGKEQARRKAAACGMDWSSHRSPAHANHLRHAR